MLPISFRNVARYVKDVTANLPLYQALGFKVLQTMGSDMAILQNEEGFKLVLHSWSDHKGRLLDTGIGFSVTGTLEEARQYLIDSGFKLLRAPEDTDAGFFFIYGDLDGNPINLVGKKPH